MQYVVVQCGMWCNEQHARCGVVWHVLLWYGMAHVECGVVQDVVQCGMGCGLFIILLHHTLCHTARPHNAHHSRVIPHITQHLCYTLHTMQHVLLWCDEKWGLMWNVMWWATCGVICFCDMEWCMWCDVEWYVECVTMLLHHALPHHTTTLFYNMEWCMMWCGMRYGMCYNVTAPCFSTSQHHSSIIPHLTAQHSTLHHFPCKTVHTMLCHIAPPHTAHHVRSGVLHHVFCDGECGVVWCGIYYNVTKPCFDTSHHHILHTTAAHFNTAPHNSSIFPQHSTSPHVTQYRPRFATSHHHVLHIMWCNEMWCDGAWNGMWCGAVWNGTLHITHALPHHTTAYCTSLLHNSMAQPYYL